jgi:hypothetical protein
MHTRVVPTLGVVKTSVMPPFGYVHCLAKSRLGFSMAVQDGCRESSARFIFKRDPDPDPCRSFDSPGRPYALPLSNLT